MIITMGFGASQRMLTYGLDNPRIFSYYDSSVSIQLPIPELIKDAYPIYFGRRPKDEHKPAYRFGDIVGTKPHFERWLQETETFVDAIVELFDKRVLGFCRKAIYTCVNERMYQALLKLQDNDIESAKELINTMEREIRFMVEMMKKGGYGIAFTFYLTRIGDTAVYSVNVSVHSEYPIYIPRPPLPFELDTGILDYDYLL